jgi:hypothetical protein
MPYPPPCIRCGVRKAALPLTTCRPCYVEVKAQAAARK